MNREIRRQFLTGECALFAERDLTVYDTIFDDGESPLKESRNIELHGCMFKWKYPLWYAQDVTAENCTWFDTARAGVWYSKNVSVKDTPIAAPKNFRRCTRLALENVSFPNAAETLWSCEDVTLKNVTIRNSRLLSKDAFWNSENVTVYDSFISGEYLGWNAKNLTLVNCTIESLQGMCYIENLKLVNCKLINTTLAFEYSTVEADITGSVDSVINPSAGSITADSIGELILERDKVDVDKVRIVCREKPEQPVKCAC